MNNCSIWISGFIRLKKFKRKPNLGDKGTLSPILVSGLLWSPELSVLGSVKLPTINLWVSAVSDDWRIFLMLWTLTILFFTQKQRWNRKWSKNFSRCSYVGHFSSVEGRWDTQHGCWPPVTLSHTSEWCLHSLHLQLLSELGILWLNSGSVWQRRHVAVKPENTALGISIPPSLCLCGSFALCSLRSNCAPLPWWFLARPQADHIAHMAG